MKSMPVSLAAIAAFVASLSGASANDPSLNEQTAPAEEGPLLTRVHVELMTQPLERYVRDSDEIIRGLVTAQRPIFPSVGLPYTELDIWVLSSVKGESERMVQVRVGGASSPEWNVDVVGAPKFFDGEEALLFLMRYRDDNTGADYRGLRGLQHGTYRLHAQAGGTGLVKGLHAGQGEALSSFWQRVVELDARARSARKEPK